MNQEQKRQAQQKAFVESGQELSIGTLDGLGIDVVTLAATTSASNYVQQVFDSGLTAVVYKLNLGGENWTLKRKRDQSLVKNIDGQTSFLNEVQRRCDFTHLKQQAQGGFEHVVDTRYASFLHGVILSPWIEGEGLSRLDESVFRQIFSTICSLEMAGLFEWDLCPGNLLVDQSGQIKLFDFGYMYRFDPKTEFNSNGLDTPMFHGVERFETRFFFDYLLKHSHTLSTQEQLTLYHCEKTCAFEAYQDKRSRLADRGASEAVLSWHDALLNGWRQALKEESALRRLFQREKFRSTLLDMLDDVHGKSCTHYTLQKADYVLNTLEKDYGQLKQEGGLFFGDEHCTQAQLLAKYRAMRADAVRYQLS